MPIRPKHTLDDSRPKAVRQFTDREEFIEAFQKALKGIKPNEQNVAVFYGVGGIGKTSLRKELGRILEKEQPKTAWTVLDFSLPQYREQETALFTLRKSFGDKYKIPFPSFDLAYAVYWQKTHPQTPLTKENFPLLDAGGIVVDIVTLFGEIPGIGLIPKLSKLVIKGKKALEDWWTKRGNRELYDLPQMEPKDILERLPMFWAGDLKDSLEQKRTQAVMFIDTYEALWGKERTEGTLFKRDEWVRELVAHLPGILWIICGREKLRWEEVEPDWGKVLDQHLLGDLADEDAERFLRSCGIENKEILRTIIEGGKGVPYYLDLTVDTYYEIKERHHRNPTPADFAQTHQEILERFLLYLDRTEIETLKVLSEARKWDKSIFELLVTHFKTGYPISAFPELCRFSFINQDDTPGTWHMHELMRDSLQEKIETNTQKAVHQCLFDYYNKAFKEIDIKNITDKQKSALQEAFYHGKIALQTAELFSWFIKIADNFKQATQWKTLVPLYEDFIKYIEKNIGPEKSEMATALNNLGLLFINLSKYKEAEPVCTRALEIREKASGPDHSDVASSLASLGWLYLNIGKYSTAEALYRRALEIKEKELGPEHSDVAKNLHYIAVLYDGYMGKHAEAEPICKRALEIREKVLGPEHPDVASSLTTLGLIDFNMGKYAEAEPLHKRALEIYKKALGPEHLNVAMSLNNIAILYSSTRKYVDAESFLNKAMEITERKLGPEHPDISIQLNNLAILYRNMAKYGEAESLYKRALEIQEKALGPDHPDVALSLNNLAELYEEMGKYSEAENFYMRALEIREKALGSEHYDLAYTLNKLAGLYKKMGKLEEAERYKERAEGINAKINKPKI